MAKLYRDKDWLWEHYIVREESSYAMAQEAGCDPATIRNWLCRFDIPIRTPPNCGIDGLWQNRDWLWEHYIVREESTYVMAKEAECNEETIRYWLHKLEIPVRNRGEGIFLAKRNSVIITPDLLEFMGGEITGDGYVGMVGNRSARYTHGSKYEEYVIWLSGYYNKWGIGQSGRIRKRIDKHGVVTYHYATRSYPELVPIHKRWYPDGKKIVPKDLRLTPIMARQWYLGDGHLENSKPGRPSISFATCDFDQQSIAHLIKELDRLGFKATHQPSGNIIYLSVYSVPDFLEWIGPCPISCYDYKWDYEKKDNKVKI